MKSKTDEELRLDFWVDQGLKPSDALRYIRDNPKPTTFLETQYLLNNRVKEVFTSIGDAFKELWKGKLK